VTNWKGLVHERLEYTPYGELWIDWKNADAPEDSTPFRFTGKEQDPETGLYYYGARYLDPKTSRWLSGDPALGEYLSVAPVSDDAKKHNQSLPGMGGVFNTVNMHAYHYAGNNPVKYVDPDGRNDEISHRETDKRFADWLRVCDPKYHIVAQDVKIYIENQATLGYRPIDAQLTQTAEEALLGREIYAIVGIVVVVLPQIHMVVSSRGSGTNTSNVATNTSKIRTLDNPNSLKGATKSEVIKLIPKDWTVSPAKKGDGIRYLSPNKSDSIIIENGWSGSTNVHVGPYARISLNGKVERIPLAGNPDLRK
jgi:RHS repeat-associated protein